LFLPLVFNTDGLRCIVIGGGEVAARKVELLCGLDCVVTVVAPSVHDAIRSAVDTGNVQWITRDYREGDCRGFQLVIAATEQSQVNRAVSEEARKLGVPVNVVDDPELCTVIFPAIWQKGPLTVAVSTEGVAPFMAAAVRNRVADQAAYLPDWVEAAGRFRSVVRNEIGNPSDRGRYYTLFLDAVRPEQAPDLPLSGRLEEWVARLEHIRDKKS
jgi:uroporphyrin-III C-methyltransferase/precorrin-2 dehydrogenase/sirohydrochlorin ferrochelatase